jgi:cytochrome c-type biogenesis protein CcmH/NrfF
MKKLSWITAFLIVLSTLAVATVSAQGSTPSDDQVNAIAKQLYCPVCENTPLDVCPTDACKEWREEIRGMLAEGKRKPRSNSTRITIARVPPHRLLQDQLAGVLCRRSPS